MKEYSVTSPSIHGILSDDYLYFEGVRKPQSYFIVRDGSGEMADVAVLEKYWNDIYNLFLRKLTQLAAHTTVNDEEALKLQALLQELIKVKGLIENASKTAIMGE